MRVTNIFFCFIMLTPNLLFAQYRITLNKSNTFHYGSTYLITTPIRHRHNVEKLFINDPSGLVPVNAYRNTWYQGLKTLFIAIPAKTQTNTRKRKHAHKYQFDEFIVHLDNHNIIDSLRGIDDSLFTFKSELEGQIGDPKKSALIYYCERVGSPCCYPERKIVGLTTFINDFEQKHGTKIGSRFSVVYGDEGEGFAYLTLSGLTLMQKMQFINERTYSLLWDSEKKDWRNHFTVYRPVWMSLTFLTTPQNGPPENKPDPEKIYASVEVQPKYPDGQEAFSALFKNIDFGADSKETLIIGFIVKRDGTLTDIKLARGESSKAFEQVKKIMKGSKKWNPGVLNGKLVNTAWTVAIRFDQF
jgi:hypothetical protein